MQIYDSATMSKREFVPQQKGRVKLYVCGPTVYDDAHLGHARSALVFDLLVRVLEADGNSVVYARNITDIDDKIIKKSQELSIDIAELTDKYIDRYHKELAELNIKKPSLEPRATESLEAMYKLIQTLIDKDHAYVAKSGDVYFDTKSDSRYLSLSKRVQDDDDRQARVQSSEFKKNSTDFALWKAVNDESVSFESPFSQGRPGWHTECSAMIAEHFCDDTEYMVDIHGGGADLLFPHHENEAAQSRCSSNKELAAYWMHNGFVNINNQKMSKSLNNSFFLKDALRDYSGEVLRFYLLTTHYRASFNFTTLDLDASKKRLDKLYRLKKRVFGAVSKESESAFTTKVLNALKDDLNTSKALSYIDEMIHDINDKLDKNSKDKAAKREAVTNMEFVSKVLGFGAENPYRYFQHGIDAVVVEQIEQLIERRNEAKKLKNFALSDSIRDEITALGARIMDTPLGTFWEK